MPQPEGKFADAMETMDRIRDSANAATKFRNQLTAEGWTEQMAEALAVYAFQTVLAQALGVDLGRQVELANSGGMFYGLG